MVPAYAATRAQAGKFADVAPLSVPNSPTHLYHLDMKPVNVPFAVPGFSRFQWPIQAGGGCQCQWIRCWLLQEDS